MVRIVGAPTDKPVQHHGTTVQDPFEVINQDDLYKADEQMTQELIWYAGYTAMTVIIFLVIVSCFASDPRACVIAFGTGSPCCLLCPCVKNLYKYTNPTALIQGSINKYVPGLLVGEDGQIQTYSPNEEEIDLLYELINEFLTVS